MSVKKLRRFTKVLLITLNIIVALSLILGCYGSYFDPRKYWFTGFFTLASFYFLLILIGFILFWLFVKRIMVFIGIIAIALSWNPLKEVVPIRKSPDFNVTKDPSGLRVMSWNVEHFDILEHKSHPERKQEMIATINEQEPDVACFQEMVASDQFSAAINYLPDFVSRLGMYDYNYTFNPKLDFDSKHHFGIIIFSKYPIINKQTVAYPPKDYNSTFQFADIVKNDDTFRVFNIHLQSLKFSNENRKYIEDPSIKDERDFEESKSVAAKFKTGFLKRKIQSERIREAVDQSPYPAIVCGDFNDVPNSYAYKTIGKGMKNVFSEKGAGIGRTFYGISPTLRIDNIFVDPRFDVQQYVRIKKKLSDHFPIIADLKYIK
ncbi:MAG: endonuclease/exonuclease/phosphatase family protein [Ferruginibacter sp.]|nr:endonuclease/exonuclease/phosphatase family protein [Ferruginibacter sp.]